MEMTKTQNGLASGDVGRFQNEFSFCFETNWRLKISTEMKFQKKTLVWLNPECPVALQPKHFILFAALVSVLPYTL